MRDSSGTVRNYWRVIRSDGSVPENLTAPADTGPKDAYSARQKLTKEGVRFSLGGLADPNLRFSYEEWLRSGRRPTADGVAAAAERDERIVVDVDQRRIAKGRAPLTEAQKAEMLGRLAAERAADRR